MAARRSPFGALLAVALGVVLTFLAVPVLALVTEVPLRRLPDLLADPVVREAFDVTARTTLVANALIVLLGTPAAYLLGTRRFRGRALVLTLVELPLVLPPAVAGIGLLAAFGRGRPLGGLLEEQGVFLPFTQWAVVLAIVFVAAPFYLRGAIAAFEAVDPTLTDAARTLGAGPARTFARVALPLAATGLVAGWALAFARGIGEFGATVMFAGNVLGETQTFPLAIYEQFDTDFDVALAIGVLLVVLSAAVLILYKVILARPWLGPRRRSGATRDPVAPPGDAVRASSGAEDRATAPAPGSGRGGRTDGVPDRRAPRPGRTRTGRGPTAPGGWPRRRDERDRGALEVDIAVGRRAFRLAVDLTLGGETLALAGPSGAGKSTLLRAIAGLVRPATGRIALDGRAWFDARGGIDVPPERRSVGLVFQEYALFPHLSVRRNVAFGGRRGVDGLLERLGIAHLADEPPGRLSGGERQRVALARALSRDPAVLLLDEPLAALDAQTRELVRGELVDLVEELRLPTIVVTHDWTDAAALGRRTLVLVDGLPRQIGTPAELVAAPADGFVASFTGGSFLPGVARPRRAGGSVVELRSGGRIVSAAHGSGPVGVVVHPWEVELHPAGEGGDEALRRAVVAVTPEGGRLRVRLDGLTADLPAERASVLELARGRLVDVRVRPDRVRLVHGDTTVPEGGG